MFRVIVVFLFYVSMYRWSRTRYVTILRLSLYLLFMEKTGVIEQKYAVRFAKIGKPIKFFRILNT